MTALRDPRDLAAMGEQIAAIRERIRIEQRHLANHMHAALKLASDPGSDLRAIEAELDMAFIHLANAKAFEAGERKVTAGQTFTAAEWNAVVAEDWRRVKAEKLAQAEAAAVYVKAASANRAPRIGEVA